MLKILQIIALEMTSRCALYYGILEIFWGKLFLMAREWQIS